VRWGHLRGGRCASLDATCPVMRLGGSGLATSSSSRHRLDPLRISQWTRASRTEEASRTHSICNQIHYLRIGIRYKNNKQTKVSPANPPCVHRCIVAHQWNVATTMGVVSPPRPIVSADLWWASMVASKSSRVD
jgi:hypothetical protein